MFLQSIRFKIVLWYMFILALTLSLFSAVLYHNLSQKLYEDMDDVLQSRAEGIIDSIDTYWEAERLEGIKSGAKAELFSKVNNVNFAKIAQRWVEERSDDPKLLNIIVQIFDVKGAPIASSKNIPNIAILPRAAFNSVSKGNTRFDTMPVVFPSGRLVVLRVFTVPVVEDNNVAYIVQVSSQLSSVYSALKDLRAILFFLLPLTVFLTGVLGAFLAKIALNPVDRMIHTIHQITAENLKLRLTVPDTRDEVRHLADTFNNMLGRLEQAFSSQREFIEDFAHELKTPLAVLRGELEVALKKLRSREEYESILCSNLEEVSRISKIVEDLLTLARFESSDINLKIEPLDLSGLLEDAVADIKILAAQKNIAINLSPKESITVNGDSNQLKRLFLNMLDNAVKYTPAGGRADVIISREDGYAKIVISDSGIGIPEDDLPRIFDRFYLVDKSRASGGFGLGLSIAKSVVEAHKGRIEVKSKVNKGTSFIIFLPEPRTKPFIRNIFR